MKKKTKYSPDFKFQVGKKYFNSDLPLTDIASKFGIPPVNTVHKWVKLYTHFGYNDDIFNPKKGRPKSKVSDISKVPPFIYEPAGITSDNSNDSSVLKKKLECHERLLFEKELLIKMQEDEINFLKKTMQSRQVTFIYDFLLILKYRSFCVSTSFLLNRYNISSSSFYYNTRLFFDCGIKKIKSTTKRYSYTNDSKKVSDDLY